MATGDTGYILRIGGWMLLVSVVQIVATIIAQFFGARAALGVGRDIRGDLLHRVNSFSAREVGTFGAPSLITRTTNDVQQVQMLIVMSSAILVMAPIMCFGGIIMGIREAPPALWWVIAIAVPILGLSMGLVIARMIPRFPLDAGTNRRGEPGSAGTDHRYPRGACLRP